MRIFRLDNAATPAWIEEVENANAGYVQKVGDTMSGALTIGLSSSTDPGLTISSSSSSPSDRAGILLGQWSIKQDYAADGTKDFSLEDSATPRFRIDTSGRISFGSDAPTTVPVMIKRSGTSFTNPTSHDGAGLMIWNGNNAAGAVANALIRVGGGSAGDPFLSFDVQGVTSWSLGIDNSDSDKFKIAPNWTDIGSSPAITIDTSGNITFANALPVGSGGTGVGTHTSGNFLKGAGSSAITSQAGINFTDVNNTAFGTSWSPTLTGITVGTGASTIYRHIQLGAIVFVYFRIVFGTGGSTSGQWSFTLPVAPRSGSLAQLLGTLWDSSGQDPYGIMVMNRLASSDTDQGSTMYSYRNYDYLSSQTNSIQQGAIGTTSPVTIASGDYIFLCGWYEA